MKSNSKFLVIDGEAVSGLFETLDEAVAECNEDDPGNCLIWEVVAKFEPGTKVQFKKVEMTL